jgi:hypothetical protein
MTNSSGNQPSRSLLCDIMIYENKDISNLPAKQWRLKHEVYLKKIEETHRAVEVVRPAWNQSRLFQKVKLITLRWE